MQVCRICDKRGAWSSTSNECPQCRQKREKVNFCRSCGSPSSEPQCESCRTIVPTGPVEIIRPPTPGQAQHPSHNPPQEFPGQPQSETPPQDSRRQGGSYLDMLQQGESGRIVQANPQPSNVPDPLPPNAPVPQSSNLPVPQQPNAPVQYVEVHHHHYSENPQHSGPPEQMPCGVCNKLPGQHTSTLYCSLCNKLYGWHALRQIHFHCLGCGNKLW